MKKVTTSLYVATLLLWGAMDSAPLADELAVQDNLFRDSEVYPQNNRVGSARTGMLIVSGALLSSPCILESNDVDLPLQKQVIAGREYYSLKMGLVGCGVGGSAVTSVSSPGWENSVMTIQSMLLNRDSLSSANIIGSGRVIVHGGIKQLVYHLTGEQMRAMTEYENVLVDRGKHSPALLLYLSYE